MGQKSRARAGRREEPGAAQELEDASLAVVAVMLPDGADGTGHLRQWYIPRQQAEEIAAFVVGRHGPPMELTVDMGAADAAVDSTVIAVGNDPYAEPGEGTAG